MLRNKELYWLSSRTNRCLPRPCMCIKRLYFLFVFNECGRVIKTYFEWVRWQLSSLCPAIQNDMMNHDQVMAWASCQLRKIAGAHAPGMPGTFSPSQQVSDPGMHHGTCVTHNRHATVIFNGVVVACMHVVSITKSFSVHHNLIFWYSPVYPCPDLLFNYAAIRMKCGYLV